MDNSELETLGDPDIKIGGLRLWVHGRQFPQSEDYWDGNWLCVTAYCVYPHSMVRAHGSFIHLGELVVLLRECEHLYQTLQGHAGLRCTEPNLNVELSAESGGRISLKLAITPDNLTESHCFTDSIDQSYLPPVIAGCKSVLTKHPVREQAQLP